MNFDEFREQLKDDLKERLAERTGQTFDISLSDVAKLQNAGYSGIVVRKEGNPLGLNLDASAIFKCIGKTDIDKTYSMPKSRISYRKPRRISEAKREQARIKMMEINHNR